jgi:hypothetical protein
MMTVLDEFRLQSRFCREFRSVFTSSLLDRAAADIEAGGIVAKLTANWPGHPRSDAVSLRLAGALHAAALTGRDPQLAAHYPAANPNGSIEVIWPIAEAFLKREEDWVRQFLASPPQTNETARAAGLAAAFMWLAARAPQPFHLLELGASAGLNLNWDRFRYVYPAWGRMGGDGPLIPTEVTGKPPAWRDIAVASRMACDQNPIDPSTPEGQLRLRAYVWADQVERMERLNAAIGIANASGLRVDKADAAQWVRDRLAGEPPTGLTVVYHSVFLQYPPLDVRAAIAEAIEEAGRRAQPDRQLAWVRFEPESVLTGEASTRYVLNVVYWNGADRTETLLADVDPHGRFLAWVAEG